MQENKDQEAKKKKKNTPTTAIPYFDTHIK